MSNSKLSGAPETDWEADQEKAALEKSAAFLQQLHLDRKAAKERLNSANNTKMSSIANPVSSNGKKNLKGSADRANESEEDFLNACIEENKVFYCVRRLETYHSIISL